MQEILFKMNQDLLELEANNVKPPAKQSYETRWNSNIER